MDLLKLLRSFEEFLFEAVTWLFFYPRTILRIVLRPLAMLDYADAESVEPEDKRFDDAISPPMLLLISLVLANALGWAAHIPNPGATSQLARELFNSQQNLLVFRCLIFSLVPLIAALTLLRKQGVPVARESLRQPFYAQSYLAAPYALAVSVGGVGLQWGGGQYVAAGLCVMAIATIWLLAVQTLWFERRLGVGRLAAFATAAWAFVRANLYLLAIVLPIVLL